MPLTTIHVSSIYVVINQSIHFLFLFFPFLAFLPSLRPSIYLFIIHLISINYRLLSKLYSLISISYLYISEKAMAPHSSTLAWKIPWAEEPGRLQSMGSHRVGHDWSNLALAFASIYLSIHPSPIYVSFHSSIHVSIFPSIHAFIHPSSTCLSIYLSFLYWTIHHLSIYPIGLLLWLNPDWCTWPSLRYFPIPPLYLQYTSLVPFNIL